MVWITTIPTGREESRRVEEVGKEESSDREEEEGDLRSSSSAKLRPNFSSISLLDALAPQKTKRNERERKPLQMERLVGHLVGRLGEERREDGCIGGMAAGRGGGGGKEENERSKESVCLLGERLGLFLGTIEAPRKGRTFLSGSGGGEGNQEEAGGFGGFVEGCS